MFFVEGGDDEREEEFCRLDFGDEVKLFLFSIGFC
jgi:hypothetical protein